MNNPLTVEQRFWHKVEKRSDGCWQWIGAVQGKYYKAPGGGYGSFRYYGKVTPAHRVAWYLLRGPIPDGLHIDHLCRNTRCVNPDHMELVTNAENHRRGVGNKGERMAARTHCPQGHPYIPENTVYMKSGGRRYRACHACRLAIYRRYEEKRKAARRVRAS